MFSKGLGSAASTFFPRIFIFTCCSTWIVPSAWCYTRANFYEIILSILVVTIAASPRKLGSALHSCVQLEQYLACLPWCEAICCCGDAGMSLLFEQQCTQSHKERIRMSLWPDQAEQLLSSISAAENRAHLWGCGHCFLWKSPSHPCSSPHANVTCALARGPVPEWRPAGDTPSLVDLAGEQQTEPCQ